MQLQCIGSARQLLTQRGIAQQFRYFRQNFKVLLCRGFGDQKKDHQADGQIVRRVKTNRLRQLEHCGHGCPQTLDTTVWYRNTVAQSSRPQAFTGEQAIRDQRTAEPVQIFEKKARFFECPFFTGDVDLRKHLRRGQDTC